MNPETKEIAESFGCPYTLFEEGADSMQVEWAWQVALRSGKKKGFCPAILVPDRYADEWLAEGGRKEPERERILAACGDNGREILMGTSEPNGRTGLDDVLEMLDLIGEETRGDALHHFSGFRGEYMDSRATGADTLLLELPVRHPWEVIAYLPMAGWHCSGSEKLITICKYWYERYGAFPAVFTYDTIEFYAPRRLNGVDSLEAAKEHCAFCQELLEDLETGKLSELAAGLEHSDVWYFWWMQ